MVVSASYRSDKNRKKKKDKGMLYRVWLDKNDIHIFQLGKVRLRSTFAYFEHAQKF